MYLTHTEIVKELVLRLVWVSLKHKEVGVSGIERFKRSILEMVFLHQTNWKSLLERSKQCLTHLNNCTV